MQTNTGSGGNDQVILKVYAPGDVTDASEPVTWTIQASGGSGVTLSDVRLSFGNAAG